MGLDRAITEGGSFPRLSNPRTTVLSDMQFDPTEPNYRLALGIAGVFLTQDGVTWSPLLRSSAVALQPTSMTYDPVACERTLYVATLGRGLLRLRPLPPDWTLPVGRLQSARGRITLLRVHDLGTGYGPAYDHLDAEVVVSLDTQPGKAFGLKLRRGSDRPAADGKLAVLRDCFTSDRPVLIDFVRMSCRTGEIVRVIEGI